MSAVLASEWKAYGSIASQAVIQRVRLGNNWLSWALLAMGALIAAGVGFLTGEWRKAVGFGFGLPLSLLAWMWWLYIVDAVRKQNHPAAFRLVPGMRARSLRVLLAVWAGLSLLVGLVMSLPLNNPVLSCAGIGLFFAVSAAMFQWQVSAGVVLLLAVPYGARKLGFPLETWAPSMLSGLVLAAIGVALLLASGWAIARGLGRVPTVRVQSLSMSASPLYASSLRGACERGERTRLLMHVLGPAADSRTQAVLIALSLAMVVVVLVATGIPSGVLHVFVVSLALPLQFGVADRLSARMYASHREQALLRLTVGAPAAHDVNAVLARAMMRRFLAWWLVTTCAAMGFSWLTAGADFQAVALFAVFCMPLMAAGTLLHGYAPRPHFAVRSKAAVVIWFLLTYLLYFMSAVATLGTLWWSAIALSALAAAYSFATWRAREMRRAPCSFPAGRSAAT